MEGPFLRRQGEGAEVSGPALGVVEVSSIARGHQVTDAMLKRAPVTLVWSRPISPGKYVVVVTGSVAEVGESMATGAEIAAETMVDRLELAQVAEELLRALARKPTKPDGAMGIFETVSVASSVLAADAACKAARVTMCELRLGDGIGGKAYFVLSGDQADVEAALYAAYTRIPVESVVGRELIARPHEDLIALRSFTGA